MDSLPARPRYRHVLRGLRPRLSADEPVAYVVELLGAATSAHISSIKPFDLWLVRRTIELDEQAAPDLAAAQALAARPAAQAPASASA